MYQADSEHDEGYFVTGEIQQQCEQGAPVMPDHAILYRTNAQSRVIEEILIKSDIPYQIVGGIKFYDRKEIKDLLAYLRLISNPDDDVSFRGSSTCRSGASATRRSPSCSMKRRRRGVSDLQAAGASWIGSS